MKKMNNKYKIFLKQLKVGLVFFLLSSCSIIPGVKSPAELTVVSGFNLDEIIDITPKIIKQQKYSDLTYKISKGDELSIVVYGQNEIFPVTAFGATSPYIQKIVDGNGEIFFPFVGRMLVEGLTVSEVRNIVNKGLKNSFKDPQVDVSITDYNPRRRVYVVGEVVNPGTVSIGATNLTLSDAISQARGLSPITSDPKDVFVIRKTDNDENGKVYRANFSNASLFKYVGEFLLQPGDVIYIGPADITKWNRFISQLFPFTSLANQLDNINNN